MLKKIKKIFVACTEDTKEEAKSVLKESNEIQKIHDISFSVFSFEDNPSSYDSQGTQNIFDKEIKESHVFIAIIGKNLGRPSESRNNETNIEGEIELAGKLLNEKTKIEQGALFFREGVSVKNLEEHKQYGEVLKFKEEKSRNFQYNSFKDKITLEYLLYKFLDKYTMDVLEEPKSKNPDYVPSMQTQELKAQDRDSIESSYKEMTDLTESRILNKSPEVVRKIYFSSAALFKSTLNADEIHKIYMYRDKINPSTSKEKIFICKICYLGSL